MVRMYISQLNDLHQLLVKVFQGRKSEAISEIRTLTGCSLKEAKDFVDTFMEPGDPRMTGSDQTSDDNSQKQFTQIVFERALERDRLFCEKQVLETRLADVKEELSDEIRAHNEIALRLVGIEDMYTDLIRHIEFFRLKK